MFVVKNENGYVVKKNKIGNKLQVDNDGYVVCTYSKDYRDAKVFKTQKYAKELLAEISHGEVMRRSGYNGGLKVERNIFEVRKKTEAAKRILDVCCGSRMFWFDRKNPNTIYMDIREEEFTIHGKHVSVHPDVVGDFRNIPFDDNSFHMVVFDPPHLKWAGPKSIMKAQYGQLEKETWQEDIKKGFEECFRVLKPNGTLIFKWSDCQIPLKDILELVPIQPLFGQKRQQTHWLTFMKMGVDYHD